MQEKEDERSEGHDQAIPDEDEAFVSSDVAPLQRRLRGRSVQDSISPLFWYAIIMTFFRLGSLLNHYTAANPVWWDDCFKEQIGNALMIWEGACILFWMAQPSKYNSVHYHPTSKIKMANWDRNRLFGSSRSNCLGFELANCLRFDLCAAKLIWFIGMAYLEWDFANQTKVL